MSKDFTPTGDLYPDYPATIGSTGDYLTEQHFTNIYSDIYERIHFLKNLIDDKDLDNQALIENLQNNIAENITEEETNEYTDPVVIANGDSHRAVIEKFDSQMAANIAQISANKLSGENNLAKISNIVDKIDIGAANSDKFTYLSTNFIVNEERLKAIVEKFDKYMLGMRRTAEFGYAKAIEAWANANVGTNTFYVHGYDTFYDLETLDQALTTASIDNLQQQASGTDLYVTWFHNTGGPVIDEVMFTWEISPGGSIEVKFHADGETTWSSMESYSVSKGIFQSVLTGGSNLAIRIKLLSNTKLYNIAYVAKGV